MDLGDDIFSLETVELCPLMPYLTPVLENGSESNTTVPIPQTRDSVPFGMCHQQQSTCVPWWADGRSIGVCAPGCLWAPSGSGLFGERAPALPLQGAHGACVHAGRSLLSMR